MESATVTAVEAGAVPDSVLPWLRSYPPGVDWDMRFPAETLPGMFDEAVSRFGPLICMDFLGRRWSFAAMGELVGEPGGPAPVDARADLGDGVGT